MKKLVQSNLLQSLFIATVLTLSMASLSSCDDWFRHWKKRNPPPRDTTNDPRDTTKNPRDTSGRDTTGNPADTCRSQQAAYELNSVDVSDGTRFNNTGASLIPVTATATNGCGKKLFFEEKRYFDARLGRHVVEIMPMIEYEGCICTMALMTMKADYAFEASNPDNGVDEYELRFYDPLTNNHTVKTVYK